MLLINFKKKEDETMDQKNMAFERRLIKIDKVIVVLDEEIKKEKDLMPKSILIAIKNQWTKQKNEAIEKECKNNSLEEYFKDLNKKAIKNNKIIDKKNAEITQKNPLLCRLLSLAATHCKKEVIELARGKNITESLSEFESYIK